MFGPLFRKVGSQSQWRMRFELLVFALALAAVSAINFGREQSAGVRGTLLCGDRPASNVKVKLYDEDDGELP